MSVDDDAEALEQLDRDVCLQRRMPVEEHTGECLNGCGAPTQIYIDTDGKEKKGAFCGLDCSQQHEQRKKFNKGRE